MEAFQYNPLPVGEGTIRILTLLPGRETDGIQCELGTRKLEAISDNKTYEALSYCWGKQEAKIEISIHEEGCSRNDTFAVRPNLHAALRVFCRKEEARKLWIDAICIDQTNVEESNVQVLLMRRVYEGCSGVLIWLGERLEDGNSEAAISLISKLK
ncbi:heterokaryon incompatibility protein-domain-containing protein, partial [Halenospora varia]